MAKATKHATERTKQRLGLSKSIADKNADKAFQFGITHGECKGDLKRYIDKRFFGHGKGSDYRVYNHHLYMFDFKTHVLITVELLPQHLCKLADKLQERKQAKVDNDSEVIELE